MKCSKCDKIVAVGKLLPCIDVTTARPGVGVAAGMWGFDDPVDCPVFTLASQEDDSVVETLKRKAGAAKWLANFHWKIGNYNKAKYWLDKMGDHDREIGRIIYG